MYKNSPIHSAQGNGHLTQTITHPFPPFQGHGEDKKDFHMKASGCFKGSCILCIITIIVKTADLKMTYLWGDQKVWPVMVFAEASAMRNDDYTWLCYEMELFSRCHVPEKQ